MGADVTNPIGSGLSNAESFERTVRPGCEWLERHPWLPSVLLTVAAAVLILPDLGSRPFWLDEAYTVANSRTPLTEIGRLNGGNMVGYYALIRPLAEGPLDTLYWLRLPSALAAIVVPAACYKVMGLVLPPWPAFGVGLLVALHPVALSHAQEARSYPIAMLLVILAWGAFIRSIGSSDTNGWRLALVLLLASAAYMHLITLFTVPAMLLCAFYATPRKQQAVQLMIVVGACVSVLTAPLLWWHANPDAAAPTWIPALHVGQIVELIRELAPSSSTAGSLIWLGCVAAGLGVSLWPRPIGRVARSWRDSIPGSWLAIPIVLIVTISVAQPILQPRYVLYTVPAVAALAMLALGLLPRRYSLAIFTILIVTLVSAFPARFRPYDEAFHWHDVTCDIATADSDVLVVFPFERDRTPVDLYAELNPECTPIARVWPDDPWGSPKREYSTAGWEDLVIDDLPPETWLLWRDLGLTEGLRQQARADLLAAGFEMSVAEVYGYSIIVERWQDPSRRS
jgi:4-amino-4-deoxy-L-arabinose transferase-like glycosyltransferase